MKLTMFAAAAISLLMAGCACQNSCGKVVRYEDFGAKGDGKTCDLNALIAAHNYANEHNLPVRANDDANYYISGANKTIIIQTNTDWGKANFTVDDRELENPRAVLFQITSRLQPYTPKGLTTLKRNQEKLDITLPVDSVIRVKNNKKKQYIRRGLNQNPGAAQQDIFCVDKNGKVDMNAPIVWDFDQISSVEAFPIDPDTLTVRGGTFTTIANTNPGKPIYINRNIMVRRSNTVVENVTHRMTGVAETGYPYAGFFNASTCAYVQFKDCILTGQRHYGHIGSAGKPVRYGTYDFGAGSALNVSLINCRQSNDHMNTVYWGVMGTNYCKNLSYENCKLSRFDAHCGVANASIRNSDLGHAGITAIGFGTFLIENTICRRHDFVGLRGDYGSSWEGKFIFRNCEFIPGNGKPVTGMIFSGFNDGAHDFGYTCYMPEEIIIENMLIRDKNHPENYEGPVIFGNFNAAYKDDSYVEKYPYIKTKRVILKNVRTESGKPLRLSDNMAMFKDVEVIRL